ncbi:MAG: DUF5309 family protein [Candidatus Pacearchaeota archaeon]
MAGVSNVLPTYGDASVKEDVVLNAVEILTAKETQIFNMLPKTKAISTVHSYLTDTLKTPGLNATEETSDYTFLQRTTPSRQTNIVQIISIPFRVSRTQREVEHYHGEDELARQTEKALREWANDAEYNLLRSTLTSGVSGTTAPAMSGILEAISTSTNVTAHSSGTVFSATILDGLMRANWENSNGDVATDLFLGSFLRSVMDGFTQKTNVVVNNPAGATSIVRTVTTYETAFGSLRVHTHRYLNVAGTDATGRVLGIRPEKLAVAFLKKPYIDTELSRSGDYDARAVVGKLTLEVKNKQSNFLATGFDID